jgi:hypothetical protein
LTETSQKPALEHWTAALKNREPTIFPKMNNVKYDGGSAQYHIIDIEIGLLSKFSDFAQKYGVTHSNITNVAWALVLQSFTASSRYVLGTWYLAESCLSRESGTPSGFLQT